MKFPAIAILRILNCLLGPPMPLALAFLTFMVGAPIMAIELLRHQEIRISRCPPDD